MEAVKKGKAKKGRRLGAVKRAALLSPSSASTISTGDSPVALLLTARGE